MFMIFFLSVLLFMTMPASGEYYQYKDSHGNQIFTDDIGNIPMEHRQDIEVFESVKTEPQQEMTGEAAVREEDADGKGAVKAKPAAPGGEREKANELSAMREELRKTLANLEAERTAIGPPPSNNASSLVKTEYNNKVRELNRKMDAYQRGTKALVEKVRAYNTQTLK